MLWLQRLELNSGSFMKIVFNNNVYHLRSACCICSDKFPLFINIVNVCNAKCDFCVNQCSDIGIINIKELQYFLDSYSTIISKISLSGGEPLLYFNNLKKLLVMLKRYNIDISINTNGYFLKKYINKLNKFSLSSIQVSRHHYDDEINNKIFKLKTINFYDLKNIKSKNKIVINCLLIKGYIDSCEEVVKFLEQISEIDVKKVNFISMMDVNDFTRDNFVDYRKIISLLNDRFELVQNYIDGKRCSCSSYLYMAMNNRVIVVTFKHTKDIHHTGRSLLYDCNGLHIGY